MKRFFTLLIATIIGCNALSAQVSIDDVATEGAKKEFENDIKTQSVDTEYFSDATYRAERRAIRKERNTIDFTSNLHGSSTSFNDNWQAAGDNTIAILANANFIHTYKNGRFSLNNTVSAKFGYNRMKMDLTPSLILSKYFSLSVKMPQFCFQFSTLCSSFGLSY